MPDAKYDIESIVQQVLSAINAGTGKDTCAAVDTADACSQLTISSPVVSLEQIEGRLDDKKQLVVPRGAVVTPSVAVAPSRVVAL